MKRYISLLSLFTPGCVFLTDYFEAPFCGDGLFSPQKGEECDDGNDIEEDSCLSGCQAAACGDGLVRVDLLEDEEGFEACDDGADNSDLRPDACRTNCAVAFCGDGVLDTLPTIDADLDGTAETIEQCDDANSNQEDDCPSQCQSARCGDGFVQLLIEECDDGNNTDGDGCDSGCVVEP